MPATLESFLHEPRIAYFSMEIAVRAEIPTFSGGLGVLAGDTMRAAADLSMPMVGVTLASRGGYAAQAIVDGRQLESPDWWQPEQWAEPLPVKVSVAIEGREVWIRGWLLRVEGATGGVVPVLLLDTDVPENAADDRGITHFLYGGDADYRLKQEIVLGIGGARMLASLGFRVRKYHLNEGHAALLTLELVRRASHTPPSHGALAPRDVIAAVRERCVFTTHTPIEAGHDQFGYDLVERVLGNFTDAAQLRALGGGERLNLTRLALNLSDYVNGVAQRHAEVSRRLFPGYQVHAITNGVHSWTWTSDAFRALYDRHFAGWNREPAMLMRADVVPDDELWGAHVAAKRALVAHVHASSGLWLDPEIPVIGFARRMTAYKRPDLLFTDLARLVEIARRTPFQIVLAGKAHPRDAGGKAIIERIHAWARELQGIVTVAFLPGYGMELARTLVAGADVWLNTPLRPLEASGTSGMKAACNGVPQLSVLDGWWLEGWIEGVTGWAIGDESEADAGRDAASLYDKLSRTVLPLYYGDRRGWIAVMKGAISRNAAYFNSHRMLSRYASEAYLA
jgi:starch phosphorylase